MNDEEFKRLFKRMMEACELEVETAEKLLHRILEILYGEGSDIDDG